MAKNEKKSGSKINLNDYIIYEQIQGMCVPLSATLQEAKEIKEHHLFPYVRKSDGTYGYFLKQSNGEFKEPSQSKWRSILHGKNSELRPAKNMPDDNKMTVFDNAKNEEVKICYWPDSHVISQKKTYSKKKQKKDEKPTTDDEKPHQERKKKKISIEKTKTKMLSQIIDGVLDDSSFCFLKKEYTKEKTVVETITISINDGKNNVDMMDQLFNPPSKKRKMSNKTATTEEHIRKKKRIVFDDD